MKITMSFEFEGTNDEVLAQISTLLQEPTAKVKKTRKTRIMTDEQKAEFRARMVAGREAKAKAAEKPIVETKPVEVEVEPVKPDKSVSKPKPSSKAVPPKPKTGRKAKEKKAAA